MDCPSAKEITSDTRPVFKTTYTHAPTAIIAAAEFEPAKASTACEAQTAVAVQTVRQAPLKKICTSFGRCSGLQSDWTSAPPRPDRTGARRTNRAEHRERTTENAHVAVAGRSDRSMLAVPHTP